MGRIKGSKNKVERKQVPKKKCFDCGLEKSINKFFKSNNPKHEFGVMNLCKDCSIPEDVDDLDEVYRKLYVLDRPFIKEVWIKSLEEVQRRKMSKQALFGIYLKNIQMKNSTYAHSDWRETEELTNIDASFLHEDNQDSSVDINKIEQEIEQNIEFTSEDEQIKSDCLRLLGYDPFVGYSLVDQKSLYGELITFLDEDTLEDQYKISVIIQILNNNNQIKKIDLMLNRLSSDTNEFLKNSGDIKNLTSIKKQITENNDKLSKENTIALKHRGDKKAGRSTLGYMMKDLRELGFEEAEEDYYDMNRSRGMSITADISHRSILNQLNFDEKDIEDMFKEQRELLLELQNKKDDLEEELRLARIEINNLRRERDLVK